MAGAQGQARAMGVPGAECVPSALHPPLPPSPPPPFPTAASHAWGLAVPGVAAAWGSCRRVPPRARVHLHEAFSTPVHTTI